MAGDAARKTWPALRLVFPDTAGPSAGLASRLAVTLDDFEPRAIDEGDGSAWLVFFPSSRLRDRAAAALAAVPGHRQLEVEPVDVPDEDWASRTQRDLTSVRVGNVIVTPPWAVGKREDGTWTGRGARSLSPVRFSGIECIEKGPGPLFVIIEPSVGFGTGHHESTRLCLRALQQLPLAGRTVLDVGTGSGVLAITAAMLGASRVTAIDVDADALSSARDNVARNRVGSRVAVREATLADPSLECADVVLANLTGGLLRREAPACERLVAARGTLVLSGFTSDEAAAVASAYAAMTVEAQLHENDWIALILEQHRSRR